MTSVLAAKVQVKVDDVLSSAWKVRDGQVVPTTEDVTMKNEAVKLTATYLYTDLRQSTLIAHRYSAENAAKIVRAYLVASCEVIRGKGGKIRSFDGDRVMGIFIGDSQRNNAVEAALGINWACDKVISPRLKTDLEAAGLKSWYASHGTGIDHGEAFIVRGGVRDNSDLVSIGRAPNIAAKLSSLSDIPTIRMTYDVYMALAASNKYVNGKDGTEMFTSKGVKSFGPYSLSTYAGGYQRQP